MKKLLIGLRASIKLIALFAVSSVIILTIILSIYKPIYSVSFKGEMLGYSEDKAALQKRILEFIGHGNKDNDTTIGILDEMPKYKLCFLKRE